MNDQLILDHLKAIFKAIDRRKLTSEQKAFLKELEKELAELENTSRY